MSNPEGPHPEYFEELCALAASGQISEPEFVELQDHLRDCARCRSAHADFIDLLHSKLPLVASERIGSSRLTGFFFERSSYRERFMARARKQGLAVSKPLGIGFWPIGYAQVAALAMALVLVAVGFLGYALRRSNARNAILAADLAAMSERFSQRGSPQGIPAPLEAAPTPPVVAPAVLPLVNDNLKPELDKAREAYAAAEARSKAVQEQLQAAASELASVRAQQEQAGDSRRQLEKTLAETELALTGANDELQKIRQASAGDAARVAAQAREIRELSGKLASQTETLDRETTLLAKAAISTI
jgi:hypothetical protein